MYPSLIAVVPVLLMVSGRQKDMWSEWHLCDTFLVLSYTEESDSCLKQ